MLLSGLKTTAESHERVMILEVMGRGAGHIALHAGVASGSHIILIPEIPFNYDSILKKIRERSDQGKPYSVIVAAEGAHPEGDSQKYKEDPSGKLNLGGIGQQVANELFNRSGIETRVTVLGHTQRGGTPSPVDRILGTAYGVHAIEMVAARQFGKIASYHLGRFHHITYQDVAGRFPTGIRGG